MSNTNGSNGTNGTKKNGRVSQAQTSTKMKKVFDDLNEAEQQIIALMSQKGRPVKKINDIGTELGWYERLGKKKGCSRVRNTLRRLVRTEWLGHVEAVGDGNYRLTKQGNDRLRRVKNRKRSDWATD